MRNYARIDFEEITLDAYSAELEIKERPISYRVFGGILIGLSLFCFGVVLRLVLFNLAEGSFYRARAEANLSQIFIERAPRGIIYDRYGQPLVENRESIDLFLRPTELVRNDEREAATRLYDRIFGPGEFAAVLSKIDLRLGSFISIKTDLTKEQAIGFKAAGLRSFFVNIESSRYFEPAFSHLVGYTGLTNATEVRNGLASVDLVGRSGLESQYDRELRGDNGQLITYRDALGTPVENQNVRQSIPGKDLRTTIDAGLQRFFYQALTERMAELGRTKGVGVAIDPENGEVLALISVPSFSPNQIGEALSDSNQPLFNRAISGMYSPGSTIKPMVATAALTEKVVSPDDLILSTGSIELPNPYHPDQPSRFLDWQPQGWVNVFSALARSSNVYFYTVGGGFGRIAGLGVERLKKYFDLFGLDETTGIDLPGELKGNIDSLGERKSWTIGDTYHISIGQGDVLITPLELLNAIATVVNGGRRYQLHLLPKEPQFLADLTHLSEQLKNVVQGMSDVVYKTYGTAYPLHTLPIEIVAKTGTVQTENNARINAVFTGCGPMDRSGPEICLLVLVEDAKAGSSNALPVAQRVFEWYALHRVGQETEAK